MSLNYIWHALYGILIDVMLGPIVAVVSKFSRGELYSVNSMKESANAVFPCYYIYQAGNSCLTL